MVRRTLDGMAAGGLYDVVGGGFHRYSVDARWLVPHFEKMLYDNALLASTYLHAWVVTGEERYRRRRRGDDRLPPARDAPRERRLRVGAGRRHRGRRGGHVHLDARRVGGARARPGAARALRARPVDRPRRARRGDEGAPARDSRASAAAVPRRQGDRLVERPRARGARGGGTPARARGLARGGRGARRVPARPASRRRRSRAPEHPRGPRQRPRVPRRPRQRRARPARAPRRDRRAALAARGAPDRRPSRSSCSRTTSAAASSSRRTTASRSRRGRRTSTTTRRPRGTRCSRPCWSGSGGSGATRRSSSGAPASCGSSRRRWSGSRARSRWALCALDLHLSPPRELAIVGDVRSDVARAALAPFQPETVVAVGPSDEVPLLEGKGLVDGLPAVYVCERFACRAPVTRRGGPGQLDSGAWRRPS